MRKRNPEHLDFLQKKTMSDSSC